jgi:hypothetical protein
MRKQFSDRWGFDAVPFIEAAMLRGDYEFVSDTDPDAASLLNDMLQER